MGRIIMNGQTYGSGSSGGGGNVDDVYVNGESVLDEDKIAQIQSYKEVTRAQYNALPDTKYSDGIMYCITDGSNNITGYPPLIYSDEEREIGVWRDGKPLYQKTLRCTFTSDVYDFTIDSTTQIKVIEGLIYASSGDYNFIHLGYGNIQNDKVQAYQYSSTTFRVQNSFYATRDIGEFIIYYTKTTDTAGSGTWNAQGATAHHYSTSEKVVGTWIDGKPLYEKTVDCGAFHSTGSKQVNHNISNLKFIVSYEGCCKADNGVFLPIPLVQDSSSYINYQIRISVSDTNVALSSPGVSDIAQIYVTLRYTKTTD